MTARSERGEAELTEPWTEPIYGLTAAPSVIVEPPPAPAPVPVIAPTPTRRIQGFSAVPLPQEIGEITGVNKPARLDRRLIALAAILAVGLVGGGVGLGVYFAGRAASVSQVQVDRALARIDAVKKGYEEARAAALKPAAPKSAKAQQVAPREAAAPMKAKPAKGPTVANAKSAPAAAPTTGAAPAPAPAPKAAATSQRSSKFSDEPNDPD